MMNSGAMDITHLLNSHIEWESALQRFSGGGQIVIQLCGDDVDMWCLYHHTTVLNSL